MPKSRNTDHVVFDANTGEFACRYCGKTLKPELPIEVKAFVLYGKAFVRQHADCKPQQSETTEE